MLWNVNSLNARLSNEHFIQYISSGDFDIICLNETKLSIKKFEALKIANHKFWFGKYN